MNAILKTSVTLIVFFGSLSLLLSCRKASTEMLNEMVSTDGMVKFSGTFSV
jgi:hypothetical protein